MSVINDDKKVIQEGRRNVLKDVEASKRDQVLVKLTKKLEDDNIPNKISNLWSRGNANRANWLERQAEFLSGWDDHLIGNSSSGGGAFEGSSNLHLPTLFTVAKTMHARFLQALLAIDPPFFIKARTEAFVDRVPLINDTMRYAINEWANRGLGIEEPLDKWLWSWITTGSGIIKMRWDCEYTSWTDVQEVEEEDVPTYMIDPSGKERLIPKTKLVEKEVEVTKKVFEGPVVDFVEVEDLLIIGGSGDPDKADAVIHRDFLTSSELWTLADRGVFSEEAVRKVIEGGSDMQAAGMNDLMKQSRSEASGQASPETDLDHDRYQILETYMKYDANGSGIFSDIIVHMHERSRTILKATYLRRVNRAGERPFKKIDFHIRNGQEYGIGIIEILYPYALEMDAMHNMRIDFGLISTMPFGFYRPSSSINPETINLEPGALIPVDNPQTDIFFPNLGNRTVFGMQEEQSLQMMIDRVTSISDLNLGVIGGQGATRTATGTKALVGEASANLDVYLRRMNRGWKRALEYLLHMLQQRIPAGLAFRVTGETGSDYWQQVKSEEDIAGDYDIEVSPNSSSSNKGIQQDVAQQILQLTSNPLDIQLQLVTPVQRYEALRNFLQSLGIKEYGRYISKPQGYQANLSPEEEANRVLRGIDVPVLPQMDHQGFIDFFDYIYKHDELLGQFDEQQTVKLALQAKKHEAMMDALKSQAAQAANTAQMQANAAQGTSMSPVGTNGGQSAQANPGAGGTA